MIKLYNSLSQRKETFKPRKSGQINIFVCGPTVYDFSHIGHAKTYIFFDSLVKYLLQEKNKIFYLQNITDIDDKIINRSREQNITPKNLALKFEKEYLNDMENLRVNSVTKYARATDYIKEIISQVERLLKKELAYLIDDGIYFNTKAFKEYGKLSKRTALQAQDSVSRIDTTLGKINRGDFCLWKFSKKGEPSWPSVWGQGRPGWHVEDTAITEKFFGPQYDIHGGGRDLIFPHHEAEIAQMEGISNKKPLAKFWLHTGFLTVNGEKMSKSLGNFITIRDFLQKDSGRILRLFALKSHYRSPIDYSEKNISQVKKELEKIDEVILRLKKIPAKCKNGKEAGALIKSTDKEFFTAIENDFNSVLAIASLFKLLNKANKLIDQNKLGAKQAKLILKFFDKIDKFLDFIFWQKEIQKIPAKILAKIRERKKARSEQNWPKSDELRKEIEIMGYKLEDVDGETIVKSI